MKANLSSLSLSLSLGDQNNATIANDLSTKSLRERERERERKRERERERVLQWGKYSDLMLLSNSVQGIILHVST